MEENKENKKKKRKSFLIILLALLAAAGLTTAGVVLGPKLFKGNPAPATDESTDESATEPENQERVALFWNVDRDYYLIQNPTEAGLSSRKVQDDGFYHILFATENGRSAQRLVKDARLMNRIDQNRVMGLVTDEKGVVIDILTMEDLGYSFVYDRYYVAEGDEKAFLLDSSSNYNGLEETVEIDGSFEMIDVSGFDETESIIGNHLKKLRAEDRVVGIADKDGKVFVFYVVERTENTPTFTAYCEYCFMDVKWKGWASETTLPTSAGHYTHYYLAHDVNLTGAQVVKANTHICVDLNGHTVECAPDLRAYTLAYDTAGLALFDHSEAQTGKIIAHGSATSVGGIICLSKGEFSLYGGTLDASDFTALSSGGAMYVSQDHTAKMYGGTIIGATSLGNRYITSEYKEASRGGVAGAVVVMGRFEMYGGTIKDGISYGEAYKTASGATAYCTSYGANIYITKTGSMLMEGGIIENGSAGQSGGNLYIASSTDPKVVPTFEMKGGIIRNGKNTRDKYNGGNLWVSKGAVFKMSGGSITGGVARNCGGNVYVNGTMIMSGGTISGGVCMDNSSKANPEATSANVFLVHPENFTMTGGTIAGYVYLVKQDDKGHVAFSGNPVIYGGKTNLNVGKTMFVHAENMGGGAKIGITASDFFTDVVSSSVKSAFIPDAAGASVSQYNGKLFIGDLRCECGGAMKGVAGHTCKLEPFTAWSSKTALPTEAGRYFLANDIQMKGQSAAAQNAKIVLDLNGHTVTGAENKRIYITLNPGSGLTVCDSKGGGKMVAQGAEATDDGMVIFDRYGEVKIYGGTFDASKIVTKSSGAAMAAGSMADGITMYGGTIIGGTVQAKATQNASGTYSISAGMGGSIVVYDKGRFTMYSGTVKDGIAASVAYPNTSGGTSYGNGFGGNVYATGTGKFEMKKMEGLAEPVVSGGKAGYYGGNLSIAGTALLEAGTVKDGYAGYGIGGHISNGGNIHTTSAGTVVLAGTEVLNGVADNCGGNLSLGGNFRMTDGTVSGGVCNSDGNVYGEYGYNAFVSGAPAEVKTFEFSGGKIDGGVALHAATYDRNLVFSGAMQIPNTSGTGLYIPSGQLLTVDTMTEGANISVNASGVFTKPTDEANKAYFKSEVSGMDISVTAAKELQIGILRCECGGTLEGKTVNGVKHECTKEIYGSWDSATTLPMTAGNYILSKDVVLTGQAAMTTAGTLHLDLNGHTVTAGNGARLYMVNNADATVTFTDSVGSGKLIGTETYKGIGGTLLARRGAMTLYNVTVEGSDAGTENGGAIGVFADAALTVYGGKITGSNAASGGAIYAYADAPVALYGTEITGNTGARGAGVCSDGAKLTITDGTKIIGNGKKNASDNDSNLYVATSAPVTLSNLSSDAEIGISTDIAGVFATGGDETLADVFAADDATMKITAKTESGTTSFLTEISVPPHKHCVCGATEITDHTCDETTEWSPLDSLNGLASLSSGYYYLTADVELTTAQLYNGKDIVICLNGHTVTQKARILIGNTAKSSLTLTDCAEKKGTVNCITGADSIYYMNKMGTLNLYGITMDGSAATATVPMINLYAKEDSAPALNVYGAKLIGMKNTANGGVVQTSAANTTLAAQIAVTIENTEITGGTVSGNGGAINTVGVLKLKNVTVKGGKANNGGGIYAASTAKLTLENVEISGNTAKNGGGLYSAGAGITMKGKIVISGNGMANAADDDSNFCASSKMSAHFDKNLTAGSKIGVSADASCKFAAAAGVTDDAILSNLTVYEDNEKDEILVEKNGTYVNYSIKMSGEHLDHCICGGKVKTGTTFGKTTHTCGTLTWTVLSDINNLNSMASGNYYLTTDQTLENQFAINGKNINICLNGHTLTIGSASKMGRILLGNTSTASLTITDCSKNPGTVKCVNANQCPFYLHNYGTINVYNVTIDGSTAVGANANTNPTVFNLGARSATAYAIGELNLYGATVIGADLGKLGGTGNSGGAIHVYSNRTANIYNSTVKDGKCAAGGGNISVEGNGTLNLYDSTVSGGTAAKGGNLYISGNVNIYGGTVSGGKSTATTEGGGNIILNTTGVLTIENATVTGGTATNQGGNIRSYGKLILKDSTVTNGLANSLGGGLYVGSNANSFVTMKGTILFTGNQRQLSSGTKVNDGVYVHNDYTASQFDLSGLSTDSKVGFRTVESTQNPVASGLPAGLENSAVFSESPSFTVKNDGGVISLIKK